MIVYVKVTIEPGRRTGDGGSERYTISLCDSNGDVTRTLDGGLATRYGIRSALGNAVHEIIPVHPPEAA
jgi:hypothetical protein